MTEQTLRKQVQLAASRLGARLFRVNTGRAWVGNASRLVDGSVMIRDPRPVRMGLATGGSDLIGWTCDGQFVAIELKTNRSNPTREQTVFLDAVRRAGGLAGVARSVEDALQILAGPYATAVLGGDFDNTTAPVRPDTASRRRPSRR